MLGVQSLDRPSQIVRKAVLLLLVGTGACAFFSDPMVDAVTNFSRVCCGFGVWRAST